MKKESENIFMFRLTKTGACPLQRSTPRKLKRRYIDIDSMYTLLRARAVWWANCVAVSSERFERLYYVRS
jgi:hypothetical protein